MISVIIRTCNQRRGCLERAIRSVFAQKKPACEIEILLVENGSQQLAPWIDEFECPAGQHIRYCHLPQADRCMAGNLGLANAHGKWVCFLDDDDELYPNYCETMLTPFLGDESIDAVCARAHEVATTIHSHTPFDYHEHRKYIEYDRPFSREVLWIKNFLPIQSVLFKRALYLEHGGFDPDLKVLEDWDLWVRYATNGHFMTLEDVTSFYRVPQEPRKRIAREDTFRNHYHLVTEKQRRVETTVSQQSYAKLTREILLNSRVLQMLFRYRVLNIDTLCHREVARFHLIENALANTTPRDAIEVTTAQLHRNRLIAGLMVSEHRAKHLLRRCIDAVRSTTTSSHE